MVGIEKAAKQINMRRRSCCTKCPFNTRPKSRCTEEIWNLCSNSFIEGFVKGAKYIKKEK
jgi:hypothetical protein